MSQARDPASHAVRRAMPDQCHLVNMSQDKQFKWKKTYPYHGVEKIMATGRHSTRFVFMALGFRIYSIDSPNRRVNVFSIIYIYQSVKISIHK